MDFSDERYVRLYTRDTPTWKRLGWEGRCLLPLLLRCVDRAGVFDLSGMEPAEAVAVMVDGPVDFVRAGLDRMVALGVIRRDSDRLVFVRFLEAQECSKSDRQRQRESRERRRAGTTSNHITTQSTTAELANSGPDVTFRDQMSRAVTSGHEQSQPVTPCLAVPCSSEEILSAAAETDASSTSPSHPHGVDEDREAAAAAPACEVLHITPQLQEQADRMRGIGRLQAVGMHVTLVPKHFDGLRELGRIPEAEWRKAEPTIRAEFGRLGSREGHQKMPPGSIAAHFWSHYVHGHVPGKRPDAMPANQPPAPTLPYHRKFGAS